MQNSNSNLFNRMNHPLKQIAELNVKTFQDMFNPEELTSAHDPKSFMERNVQMFISNGHKSLDYMSQLFNIFEDSWMNISSEANQRAEEFSQQSKKMASTMERSMKNKSQSASGRGSSSASGRGSSSGRSTSSSSGKGSSAGRGSSSGKNQSSESSKRNFSSGEYSHQNQKGDESR